MGVFYRTIAFDGILGGVRKPTNGIGRRRVAMEQSHRGCIVDHF